MAKVVRPQCGACKESLTGQCERHGPKAKLPHIYTVDGYLYGVERALCVICEGERNAPLHEEWQRQRYGGQRDGGDVMASVLPCDCDLDLLAYDERATHAYGCPEHHNGDTDPPPENPPQRQT